MKRDEYSQENMKLTTERIWQKSAEQEVLIRQLGGIIHDKIEIEHKLKAAAGILEYKLNAVDEDNDSLLRQLDVMRDENNKLRELLNANGSTSNKKAIGMGN